MGAHHDDIQIGKPSIACLRIAAVLWTKRVKHRRCNVIARHPVTSLANRTCALAASNNPTTLYIANSNVHRSLKIAPIMRMLLF